MPLGVPEKLDAPFPGFIVSFLAQVPENRHIPKKDITFATLFHVRGSALERPYDYIAPLGRGAVQPETYRLILDPITGNIVQK